MSCVPVVTNISAACNLDFLMSEVDLPLVSGMLMGRVESAS